MNPASLMAAFGKAFIVSLVLTPIVRDIFRSYNVVDRPGRRKVHAYPIPRVGGIPIAAAYVFGLISLHGQGSPFPVHWLQTILTGALIIFLTGLIDDFANLKPTVKLMGQIVAAAAAFFSGIRIDHLGGIPLPVIIGLPVTVFWLLLTTNALNLIDGLDGLCGGIGFWGTLAFFAAALTTGNATVAYTVFPLAGALFGFLFFNFNPATVFLGDSGALLIGFLLGCFSIVWAGGQITPITIAFSLFALCVPMMDLGLSIIRRSLKRQAIFSADRGHIHHRLLDRGLSVRRAASGLYAAEVAGGIFGVLLAWIAVRTWNSWYALLETVVLISAAIAALVGVRYLRYAEFEVVGSLLFRGEFRNLFAQKLRIQQMAASLRHARTEDEWWRLLAAAGRNENWIRLRWTGSRVHRDELLADRRPSWSFAIELDAAESILVEGDAETAQGSSDLIGIARVVTDSFVRFRQECERPAHS